MTINEITQIETVNKSSHCWILRDGILSLFLYRESSPFNQMHRQNSFLILVFLIRFSTELRSKYGALPYVQHIFKVLYNIT